METQNRNENREISGIVFRDAGEYNIGIFVFSPNELTLRLDGVLMDLPYQEALLLRLLLEAPYHFLPQKGLIDYFWPSRSSSSKKGRESLAMAVSRLRKSLRADPRIRLVCLRKIGYELSVGKE